MEADGWEQINSLTWRNGNMFIGIRKDTFAFQQEHDPDITVFVRSPKIGEDEYSSYHTVEEAKEAVEELLQRTPEQIEKEW